MEKNYHFLDIEINKPIYRKLSAVQYDNNSRYILVSVYSNFKPYDLTYTTVKIYGIKKDKTVFFNNAKILDAKAGKFEIDLTEQCLAVAGDIEIQILILGANQERLSSNSFVLNVKKTIIDPIGITSQNEWGALTEGLANLAEYDIYKRNIVENTNKLIENTTNIKNIVQVDVTNYKKYVTDNNNWHQAFVRAIAENNNAEIFVPAGDYNVSSTIKLGRYNSLKIDKGATIIAIEKMPILIQKHNDGVYTVSEYNRIYGGGKIDCKCLADDGVSLGGYRHFVLEDLKIYNPLKRGVISRYEEGIFAVELMARNIYVENEKGTTHQDTIGIYAKATDSHFENIITVNMDVGIANKAGGNKFFNCHHWVYDTARLVNNLAFLDDSDGQWNVCYADTANVAFELNGSGRVNDCTIFNSPEFPIEKGTIAFRLQNPDKVKSIQNVNIIGSANSKCNKVFVGTLNANTIIKNIHCNEHVREKPNLTNYFLTRVHEPSNGRYYKFASIEIPKVSMSNSLSGKFQILNNHDESKIKNYFQGEVEFSIKAFTSSTLKFLDDIRLRVKVKGDTLKNKIKVSKVYAENTIIVNFYYDFNTDWDYLQIKIIDLIGGFGWYTKKTSINIGENLVGTNIKIYENSDFTTSINEVLADIDDNTIECSTINFNSYRMWQHDGLFRVKNGSPENPNEGQPLLKYTVVPPTPTSPGKVGEFAYTNDYLYICVDTNKWRRITISSW